MIVGNDGLSFLRNLLEIFLNFREPSGSLREISALNFFTSSGFHQSEFSGFFSRVHAFQGLLKCLCVEHLLSFSLDIINYVKTSPFQREFFLGDKKRPSEFSLTVKQIVCRTCVNLVIKKTKLLPCVKCLSMFIQARTTTIIYNLSEVHNIIHIVKHQLLTISFFMLI